jgi:predicted SnoaL-like aldol condensation-catalyzing enzyme
LNRGNREVVEDFLHLINHHKRIREAFETHVREDYVQHNPSCRNGREDAISLIEGLIGRPGFRASVKRMIVDGDLVASHMHVEVGGGDPGLAVVDIWRLQDGKIAEHWDVIQEIPATTASGSSIF